MYTDPDLLSWEEVKADADRRQSYKKRRGRRPLSGGGLTPQELADPVLTMGSAIASAPAAGITGLGIGLLDAVRGGSNPMAAALDAQRGVEDRLTFQPRTLRGQENLLGVAEGMESLFAPLEAGAQYLGDKTLGATGSPALATVAHMTPDIVETLLGLPPALKGGRKLSGLLDSVPQVAKRSGPGKYQTGSVGGSGAKGLPPEIEQSVRAAAKAGASPEDIWSDSGAKGFPAWLDSENRFKFEFDDSKAGYKQDVPANLYEAVEGLDGRKKDTKRIRELMKYQYAWSSSDKAKYGPELAALKDRLGLESDYSSLGAQFEHPGMKEHYPDTLKMKYSERQLPSNEYGSYDRAGNAMEINRNHSPEDRRSTVLHEANHGIQGVENHPRGGSVGEFARERNQADIQRRYAGDQIRKLEAEYPDPTQRPAGVNKEIEKHRANLDRFYKEAMSFEERTPFQRYENLLGEDESRAVEKRRNLSMDERLRRPFWQDMDSPQGQHIIRYD
ncbi:MAG: hypothetical protein ACTSRN_02575 [Alphaproteobacteria bacterium]